MRGTLPLAATAFVVALAPACGGAVTQNLFPTDDDAGTTIVDSGRAPTPDSGSAPIDSGVPPVMDAVAPTDVSTPVDTGMPIDEPAPTGPSVSCPMNGTAATCQPGEYCCITGSALQGGGQMDTCETMSSNCGGTRVTCTKTADCPSGEVCCGTVSQSMGMTGYSGLSCAASCTTTQRTFCDPAAKDCPALTPSCLASQILSGYYVCQ